MGISNSSRVIFEADCAHRYPLGLFSPVRIVSRSQPAFHSQSVRKCSLPRHKSLWVSGSVRLAPTDRGRRRAGVAHSHVVYRLKRLLGDAHLRVIRLIRMGSIMQNAAVFGSRRNCWQETVASAARSLSLSLSRASQRLDPQCDISCACIYIHNYV